MTILQAATLADRTLSRPSKEYKRDALLSGPDYPPPAHLGGSALLQAAIAKFEAYLDDKAASSNLLTDDTAFAVALFSAQEKATLYEKYYTPPAADMGVREVDQNSVFRIGSISKVITVWAFLIAAGDGYWSDPVTKHVPELAELVAQRGEEEEEEEEDSSKVVYDDIDCVRWEDITLGQLASHGAGIARDLTWMDHSHKSREQRDEWNLPELDPADIPGRGDGPGLPECSRKDFFYFLTRQHPHFPPAHSPVYSNIAYQLLAYALEAITGDDLRTLVETNIFAPLGMTHSTYETPPPTSSGVGVVPVSTHQADPSSPAIMWTADSLPAMDHPGGANYMSTADLVRAGQAILQSTLLAPAQTRRWLAPTMLTGDPTSHVGAPWEIFCRSSAVNGRTYEYYTKAGDVGAYDSTLVLSPQHGVGWTVLAAGAPTPNGQAGQAGRVQQALTNAFHTFFLEAAVEAQARQEAAHNFDGYYVNGDDDDEEEEEEAASHGNGKHGKSAVTIVAGYQGHPGLAALDLTFRGRPFDALAPVVGLPAHHRARPTLLYPSTLKTVRQKTDGSGEHYESRLGFRAIFWAADNDNDNDNDDDDKRPETALHDPSMAAWGTVGHVKYGQRTMDDWVFEMGEDGRAVAVQLRALRVRLRRREKNKRME